MPARVGPMVSDGVVEVAPLPIVVGGSRSSGHEQRRGRVPPARVVQEQRVCGVCGGVGTSGRSQCHVVIL